MTGVSVAAAVGLCVLAGCAAAPPPPPIVITRIVQVPVPVEAPRPTTILATAPRVAAILHDSHAVINEATRYAGWHGSDTATIVTLGQLARGMNAALAAMVASKKHGRYSLPLLRLARARADATAALLHTLGTR